MKKYIEWVTFIGIITFFAIIVFQYRKKITQIESLQNNNISLIDSVNKFTAEKYYFSQLIWLNLNVEMKYIPNNVNVYEMADKTKKNPIGLRSFLSGNKKKLIVRYTEIGCNACTDSTFKFIRKNDSLLNKYDVFVLVDFTDYESYIKWRKISEITDKVLWLKKGTLPFHIEKENTSYLFVADREGNASSFFIPNSKHSDYLRMYFKRLAN
ncbi:MAG: hypothetical protein JXB49_29435 [Bacteroidales bacterium]|nr:hypothetical protein [Bacteroidales bacterium]